MNYPLAYSMTAIFPGQPGFSTEVELTFAPDGAGTRLALAQRGFPGAATPGRLRRRLERSVGHAHPRRT
jgi:hypothetical protein